MTRESLVAEMRNAGVVLEAADGQLRLVAPTGTITPNLLEFAKNHKAGLLEILQDCSPSPKGLSAVGSLFSPNAPGTQVHPSETLTQTPADGESYADREFRRFEEIAQPMAGGGLYCPVFGGPRMPSGVDGEAWRRFENDCRHLGKAVRV